METTQIGNATLYCGDCLEILPQLSGGGYANDTDRPAVWHYIP